MLYPVRRVLILLLSLNIRVLAQDQTEDVNGVQCCDALRAQLPQKVFGQGSSQYDDRHSRYYSLQEQELFPNCTVQPTSASDVSKIMKFAGASQCPFAVASGGHMSWKGSSNMDGGFVIDLKRLNQIDISVKDQTVKLGPGSQWTEVYAAMAPFNVSTTGARINAVGVGGFLLGGGIAFASVDKGFGADNVFNYEVVLSNGRIINVNKTTNSDLFWALKLAGSNFGIVTRFDMHTYPSPAIWGGVAVYPTTEATESDLLEDFAAYTHNATNKKDFKSVAWNYDNGTELTLAIQTNLDAVPLHNMSSTSALSQSEKIGSTHDVVDQVIAAALASTARTHWFTFTTKVSTDFFKDLHAKTNEIFGPLRSREGLTTTVGFQSFQKSYIARAAGTPTFNALKKSNDDLVCTLILTTWTDPADEAVMKDATNALGAWAEDEARRRGILNDFIYLNYANEGQDVYTRSVLPQDLDRMRSIRNKYDANGMLQKLWRGGYKLPK